MLLSASELAASQISLQNACLSCHEEQQIPSELIYRRYLMKYSTDKRMGKAILHYLKDPKKSHSIMPLQFFLKFPMKKALKLDNTELKAGIKQYLEKFDVKKKFVLEK